MSLLGKKPCPACEKHVAARKELEEEKAALAADVERLTKENAQLLDANDRQSNAMDHEIDEKARLTKTNEGLLGERNYWYAQSNAGMAELERLRAQLADIADRVRKEWSDQGALSINMSPNDTSRTALRSQCIDDVFKMAMKGAAPPAPNTQKCTMCDGTGVINMGYHDVDEFYKENDTP